MRNQPHDAGDSPGSSPITPGRPPRHVVVATGEQDVAWGVFHAFEQLSEVRVTGCASMTQARCVCAVDPPQIIVLDMRLLADNPTRPGQPRQHRPAAHPHRGPERPSRLEVGARFGKARLTFLQKPVTAENLDLLLMLKIDEELPLATAIC